MTITVVVINYNSGDYLKRCLEALLRQSCDDYRVVVADNNSTDDSFDAARTAFETALPSDGRRYRFVEIGENSGFARGNNLMIADIETPLVALLNPDAIPAPDWLDRLLSAANRYPGVAMFGSTQISLIDPSRLDGVGDNYLAAGVPWRGGYGQSARDIPAEGEVFSPCAAAAMYRTAAFRAVGGFDESYFCYAEDIDLGFRLRLSGGSCIQVPTAVVHHAGGASSLAGGSDFARYHGTRNLIWTFVKNMPGPLFWALLPAHIAVIVILLVKGFVRGEGRVILRAVCDAVKGLSGIWRQRREIQRNRQVPLSRVIVALAWNPFLYWRRATVAIDRNQDSGAKG